MMVTDKVSFWHLAGAMWAISYVQEGLSNPNLGIAACLSLIVGELIIRLKVNND